MNRGWLAGSVLIGSALLAACSPASDPAPADEKTRAFVLPEPISNNAVAAADSPDGPALYSFGGLGPGKDWRAVTKGATVCLPATRRCRVLPDMPVERGRLASAAVTLGGQIYVFGGYTVARDGAEKSMPEVLRFDPATATYERRADMPVPVDDAVVLPYRDRYAYVVSGWHDEGNVALVQLYDSQTDSWNEATAFPGTPVFGHAGGISGDSFVVSGGVAVAGLVDGKRKFVAAPFTWRGDIDPADPARIDWRRVSDKPGDAVYRMAAGADGSVVFAGGADRPYNFDGIGYDGTAAEALDEVWVYDLATDRWRPGGIMGRASMDHRALAKVGRSFYIVGGMDARRQVTDRIGAFRPDALEPE